MSLTQTALGAGPVVLGLGCRGSDAFSSVAQTTLDIHDDELQRRDVLRQRAVTDDAARDAAGGGAPPPAGEDARLRGRCTVARTIRGCADDARMRGRCADARTMRGCADDARLRGRCAVAQPRRRVGCHSRCAR